MEMPDNHFRDGSLAGEDGEYSPVESTDAATVDTVGESADQVGYGTNGTREADDGGREDTFVDCPDEIENSETQQNSQEKELLQDNQFHESDSGNEVQEFATEMDMIHDMQEKNVSEKDGSAQEHEEERVAFKRGLTRLCYQLKVLKEQHPSSIENDDRLVNHFPNESKGWDEKNLGSGASLNEMICECSMLLDTALSKPLHSEGKVEELNAVLSRKDQEIDFLNTKVAELSESKHGNLFQLNESGNVNDQHIEEIVNRTLSSLSLTLHRDELLEGALEEKISNVEKSVLFLVEKYNFFLSETDQLRACLTAVGSDINTMDEIETFVIAHDKIFELRSKEENLLQNLSYLDGENRKLLEQLEKQQSVVESANSEIENLSAVLEQEKNKYANIKEKLSMAVTKGKALVQQRDSLKLSLAEKTSELEKCFTELQKKSDSLEAAASLQESLAEKDTILKQCAEILSEVVAVDEPEPIDFTDKLRWLADENKSLKGLSLQYHKMNDALSFLSFPETIESNSLDSRVCWLAESFYASKQEAIKLQKEIDQANEAVSGDFDRFMTLILPETLKNSYLLAKLQDLKNSYEVQEKLQHELIKAREAAENVIDQLNTSRLAESGEKNCLQMELDSLRKEYEAVVRKEYQLSLEKDQIVSMLREASGLANDGQQEDHSDQFEVMTIIDSCLANIQEKTCHIKSDLVEVEIFERFQSLLYIRDIKVSLCELLLDEDMLHRMEVNRMSNELQMTTRELNTLKDEKAGMRKSFEQLEEKCALLREKLSMAVKKGKGLFQERENLKGSLSEKNVEIDRLRSELQLNISAYNDCQDQIKRLSLDVDRISRLETDLVAAQEHADQLKKFLAESNSRHRGVVDSIEGIAAPTNLVFEEPVEKVKWLVGYLSDLDIANTEMAQELRKVKDEASSLASKLSEAQTVTKSLEDALSMAENNISLHLDEKRELSVSKSLLEEELHREKKEASSNTSKFEEMSASKRALEDALSLAENNISHLMNDRDIAIESQTVAEEQIHKLREESAVHNRKLADADKIIQSLEVALSQAQENVSQLSEENSKVRISWEGLDNEIKKLREEADSHATKLADAFAKIKSLEDSSLLAENNMTNLILEKNNAEKEIVTLNSELKSCMEELAGIHGSKVNFSLELSGQINRLYLLLEDETVSTLLELCFKEIIGGLKNMDFQLKEMEDIFMEMDSDVPQKGPFMEDASSILSTLSRLDSALNMEMLNDVVNAVDSEIITFHIEQIVEKFHLKGKMLADKVENVSSCMDESIQLLLNSLQKTKDRIIAITKYVKSMKQQAKSVETDKEAQEDTIASLKSDIRNLSSACTDATQELELNAQRNISELRSILEFLKLDGRVSGYLGKIDGHSSAALSTDPTKTTERMLLAARQNQDITQQFLDVINKLISITEDMHNKLKETELIYGELSKERDLYLDKTCELGNDLKELKNSCHDMKHMLDDYQEKDDKLTKREREISASLSKIQELEDSLLSASEIKSIWSKISAIAIPDTAFAVGDEVPSDSANMRKLVYIIDSFNGYVQKVNSLSDEKKELQSIIDKQISEIELLKSKVKEHIKNEKDSRGMVNELSELKSGLQDIVKKLGGNEMMVDQNLAGVLPLLDELVLTSMLESENLRSENKELGAKLLWTERIVDDLSNKVKVLEEYTNAKITPTETDQERGTSKASVSTQLEITEIQDLGAVGTSNNIPLAPSAAHARTLRKGSSEHLAININSESDRLMNSLESDEDKGHIFKSLNTSGLIPRQGRTAADRIDGIWVSSTRTLMSHPRGRLGLMAYWLVLHIWLFGTIL
ncbi:trans-Golgi network-localized SYP41-interacting protein 1-like isoform X2 [Primulina huaijiensis]|uniref:trans-Golgi network-localized SYP41-interacting protein 1-like isoform X2 n=1 Tax=Primulina huaijiensis TaxID=1492673 RepID=UPI003CC753E6